MFEEAIAEEEEEIEQAIISMCNENDRKKVRTMRFKGEIAQVPICALLDSGSTHSFINSNVIEGLPVKITKTTPMVVLVANGGKMVTESKCDALTFSLQGIEFEKDRRILDVQGYDLILGLYWLT